MGLTPRPLFYAYPGRGTQLRNSSYEFMETRRPQNTINYTDCTRPLLGSGRNRYMRILPSGTAERPFLRIIRRKLLYVTYPKLSGPFVEFHKAIFWGRGNGIRTPSPVFRIVRRKLLYVVSAEGQRNAAPPYNPVRRSWQHAARAFGMRRCRAKQEIPPFSRS